ncbi:sugar transferase [Nocardioides sp. SYSU DS0663]|uniref:sugar transferase n=1 Tax=Nocardioides sp. SYSU DS0663 TaxID=3416445 RepID=UPI003F4B1E9B
MTRPSRALKYLPTTALALDALVLLGVGVAAAMGRERISLFTPSVEVSHTLGVAGPLMLGGWLLTIAALGGYRTNVFGAGVEEYKRVINASFVAAGLVGVGCYLASFELSRGFFLLAFVLGVVLLSVERLLLRRALHQARRTGALRQNVLIAGSPSCIDEIAGVFRRESWLGYQILGALVPADERVEETDSGVPVLGTTDAAVATILESGADIVFLAGGAVTSADEMRTLVWELENDPVQVVVAPSVTDVSRERVRVRPVGGLPLMHIDPPRSIEATRRAKRLFDIAGSAALLFLFAPIFLFTALAIFVHDRGPVLFRQTRTGQDGREFSCFKFRTMVVDAEARLAELHAQQGYQEGLFKMKNDPRITGPGAILRRYSLDELPQLINVLRGDMSLVGPRPPLPLEVEKYDPAARRRLHVRPGMTGLWQVSGRSDLSWSEAIRLDLYYVDNWSMVQDLSILAKTFGAVFGSRGAY